MKKTLKGCEVTAHVDGSISIGNLPEGFVLDDISYWHKDTKLIWNENTDRVELHNENDGLMYHATLSDNSVLKLEYDRLIYADSSLVNPEKLLMNMVKALVG